MIYKILQIAWWAVCLSCGVFFGYWGMKEERWDEKIFFFVFYIASSILIAALVQGFFTWFGNLLAHL